VPRIIKEDMMMIIAQHPNTQQIVFEEITNNYPLLHHAIYKGAMRFVSYLLKFRPYPGMLKIRNKYNETVVQLAVNRAIDLTEFLPFDDISLMPPLKDVAMQQVPEGFSVLPCPAFVLSSKLADEGEFKFRMVCVTEDSERSVGGEYTGLRILPKGIGESLEFMLDQPVDIYGSPLTLGPKGMVRWFVPPTIEEEHRLASLLDGNGFVHEPRFTQRTSVRHFDYKLLLAPTVTKYHEVAYDFAWSFYVRYQSLEAEKTMGFQQETLIRQFYEEKKPIEVVIGNSYGNLPQGVFVTIDTRDGESLCIKQCKSVADAAIFRLYPL
jgi:hypothetical protein